MADGTKDPFDFPDDPLAGVDDLDIPSFGSPEEPPAVLPPLPRSAFLPPESTPPSDPFPPPQNFPPPQASPSPWESSQGFPAPQASPTSQEFPPPQASAIPPISGTDFPPPSAQPPITPPGYGATTPPGSAPPPGAPGPVPGYAQGAGPGFPPPAKKRKGCLFWGLLGFVAFIVLVGGCSIAGYLLVRGPVDATNNFLAEAAAGDFEGAAAISAPGCDLTAAQIEADLGGLSDYTILIANTGTGSGTQTGGTVVVDGTTFPFSAELTKNASDEWAVCSYEFADIVINNN